MHTGNQLLQCINPLKFPLSPPLFTQFALTFGSACLTKYPRVAYLGLELQRLPDQLDLLPSLVLLHHREAEGELRHLQPPSPPETRNNFSKIQFVLRQECQQKMCPHHEETNSGISQDTRMTSFLQGGQCPIRSWGD